MKTLYLALILAVGLFTTAAFCSPITDDDRPEDLIDMNKNEILRDLKSIEAHSLMSGHAATPPWSGSFWPLSNGLIAARYADPHYPRSKIWAENYQYILNTPPSEAPANAELFNHFSPAEKYDLIIGASDFSLTQAMWDGGIREYSDSCANSNNQDCMVLNWEGLCHGWAVAAIIYPEPKYTFQVSTAHGKSLQIYPSDVKALQSLLAAYAPPQRRFIGKRCRLKDPPTDEVGRVLDPSCNDTNPATLHLVLVNQMGIKQSSFIMDSAYDIEVWNYPIDSYRYNYFNPQTLEITQTLESATVTKDQYTLDKFKKYRSPQVAAYVGIAMDVTYTVPTVPTAREQMRSRTHTVTYLYDLELDAEQNIIGGEWYTNLHPDFLWKPIATSTPITPGDTQISHREEWDGSAPLPATWQKAARMPVQHKLPLASIVERLSQLSQIPAK
jgi:hypothetical protein